MPRTVLTSSPVPNPKFNPGRGVRGTHADRNTRTQNTKKPRTDSPSSCAVSSHRCGPTPVTSDGAARAFQRLTKDVWWGETQDDPELETRAGHQGTYSAPKKDLDNHKTPTTRPRFKEFVKTHLVLLQLKLLDFDSDYWNNLRGDLQWWLEEDMGFMGQGPYAQFAFTAVFEKSGCTRDNYGNLTTVYGAYLALPLIKSTQLGPAH